MKKSSILILLALITSGITFNKVEVVNAVTYSELEPSYYNSASGLEGEALLEELAKITYNNHKEYTSYEDIKTQNAYSDMDPNNSSNLLDFYTKVSIPSTWDGGDTWNREHVWCQSLGDCISTSTGAGTDIHHIRPTISSINSARGNKLFTDQEHVNEPLDLYKYNNKTYGIYEGSNYWEPNDDTKGDVARILMYLYMHYSTEVSANVGHSYTGKLEIQDIAYTTKNDKDASFDMLVDWHNLDPVDEFEKKRNDYCAYVTGTRNPFIDNASYANAIWGEGENTPINPDPEPEEPNEPDTPSTPTNGTTITYDSSSKGYSNGQEITTVQVDDNVTITFNKGSNNNAPKYYDTGTAIRCYGGNTITINSKTPMTKITLTFSSGEGSNDITTNVGKYSDNTWTGESEEVTFTIGGTSGHRRIKAIEISYSSSNTEIEPEVPTPEVNYYNDVKTLLNDYYNNGTYTRETKINLTQETSLELKEYFHANVTILERTTYFNKEGLWLSRDDDKYSYYGTLNGNMTNNTVSEIGETSSKICVSNTTMEDYYTTLLDIKDNNKVLWTKENKIFKSTDSNIIQQFLDFTAPCFLGLDETHKNYFQLSHVEVEDKIDYLELRLVAKEVDTSKFIAYSNNVLSIAKISKDWPKNNESEDNTPTTKEVKFEFGENGTPSHSDGSDLKTSDTYTADGYTLEFSSVSKVYKNARDAKGNSCLKLGTGDYTGSFEITVPENVTSVTINVTGYKEKTVGIDVNGTTQTIKTLSNNGEYTAVTIDTSKTKTITFKTTTNKRAMIDSIIYKVGN